MKQAIPHATATSITTANATAVEVNSRFDSRHHGPALPAITIEPGTFDDYKTLARYHYKGSRPGAVTSIFRIVHHAPTVVDRFLKRQAGNQTIGVLVRSLPQLSCHLRDLAMTRRYCGISRREAAVMLNREVRTISRVVIDPQWRGMGLAVNLVRHALANPEPGTLFTEALAAMGRVSPFFERAGMTRYDRPPRPQHARLIDALRHAGIQPFELASSQRLEAALTNAERREFVDRELRRWHRAAHHASRAKLPPMSFEQLLAAARDELLAQPVYFIFRHDRSDSQSQAAS
jgi:GNAT superfamily N-acetyltransferase